MSKSWYKIQNKAGSKARIDLYEEIGFWGVTAQQFVKELNAIDATEIDLHINSGGGSVTDGWAIFYNLKAHKAKVNGYIDGICASMATVIALACDTLEIVENGWFMIHNPLCDLYGTSDDFRKLADMMDKMKEQIVSVYAAKSNLPETEIKALMDAEAWLTAQEALEKGFVDTIGQPIQAVACANAKRFRNAPRSLVEPPEIPTNEPKTQEKSMIDKDRLVNLGIATATASEADALSAFNQFVNAAKANETAISELKASIQKLETEKADLEKKVDSANVAANEAKAQAAVDAGKIDAKQKDAYLALLKADPANAEAFVANMAKPAPAAPGRPPINAGTPPVNKPDAEMTITERALAAKAAIKA